MRATEETAGPRAPTGERSTGAIAPQTAESPRAAAANGWRAGAARATARWRWRSRFGSRGGFWRGDGRGHSDFGKRPLGRRAPQPHRRQVIVDPLAHPPRSGRAPLGPSRVAVVVEAGAH